MSNTQINSTPVSTTVNVKLIDSLVQIIHTLSADEQTLLYAKLYDEPSTLELMHLAETAFQEWNDPEEDLYEPEP